MGLLSRLFQGKKARDSGTAAKPVSFYFVCSGNESLIVAYDNLFRVAEQAGWGRVGRYRLNLFDGPLSSARETAQAQSTQFAGEEFLGKKHEHVDQMEELLGKLGASAHGVLHVAFAEVSDAHAEWVHQVYNELLGEAVRQGILPFRMYVTRDPEASQAVLTLLQRT